MFSATVYASAELFTNISATCDKEITEVEADRLAGVETKTMLVEMMGIVNQGGRTEDPWASWKQLSIAIDSGAAATVMPPHAGDRVPH